MATSKLGRYDYNKVEFARICQVTDTTIDNWVKEGMPEPDKPTPGSCWYTLETHLPWVIENKWKPGKGDRDRKLKAEADLAVMERDLQAGRLQLVADAEAKWGAALASMRARLLSIPSKVGALITREMTEAQRSDVVRSEIYEALEALSTPTVVASELPEEPEEQPTIKRKRGRPAKVAS